MTNLPETQDQPLVRCEVTGQMLPEDETVVINGMRVSAEGKALLMEQLRTGEALPGELEAPGSWRRLGCSLLDVLIMLPVSILMIVLVVAMNVAATAGRSSMALIAQHSIEILFAAIFFSYYAFFHAYKGQTLGKMAGKFRVTRMDGSPISFKQSLVCAFMYTGINSIGSFVGLFIALISSFLVVSVPIEFIVTGIGVLVWVYALSNCICVLVHPQKRAIHDLVAGTRAVMIDN